MESRYFQVPNGPPVKLRPGRIPLVFVISSLTLLWFLVVKYTLIPWLTAGYSQLWDFWIYLHIFGFTITYLMSIWCYWVTWRTQPAIVPPNWTPDKGAIDPLTSDGKIRYCEKCEEWQPPRAQHCHFCKRCVLMRDQHCPWFNGCIGLGNTKSYFLFFFYLICFLSTSIFITGSWIFLSFVGYEFEECHWGISWNCWIISFITFVPMVVLGVAFFFFLWQFQLIMVNATSQEFQEYFDMRKRNQEKLRGGIKDSEAFERWPYDTNDVNDNASQFLGPNNWLTPTGRDAINDGTRFELNEHWLLHSRPILLEEESEII